MKTIINIEFKARIMLDAGECEPPAADSLVQAVQSAVGYAGIDVIEAQEVEQA